MPKAITTSAVQGARKCIGVEVGIVSSETCWASSIVASLNLKHADVVDEVISNEQVRREMENPSFTPFSVGHGVAALAKVVDRMFNNNNNPQEWRFLTLLQPPGSGKSHAVVSLAAQDNTFVAALRCMNRRTVHVVAINDLCKILAGHFQATVMDLYQRGSYVAAYQELCNYTDAVVGIATCLFLSVAEVMCDLCDRYYDNSREMRMAFARITITSKSFNEEVVRVLHGHLTPPQPMSLYDHLKSGAVDRLRAQTRQRVGGKRVVFVLDELHVWGAVNVSCLGGTRIYNEDAMQDEVYTWLCQRSVIRPPKRPKTTAPQRDFIYALVRAAAELQTLPKLGVFVATTTESSVVAAMHGEGSPYTRDNVQLFQELPSLCLEDVRTCVTRIAGLQTQQITDDELHNFTGRPLFVHMLCERLAWRLSTLVSVSQCVREAEDECVKLCRSYIRCVETDGITTTHGTASEDLVTMLQCCVLLDDGRITNPALTREVDSITTWLCSIDSNKQIVEPLFRRALLESAWYAREYEHGTLEGLLCKLDKLCSQRLFLVAQAGTARIRGSFVEGVCGVLLLHGDLLPSHVPEAKSCAAVTTADELADRLLGAPAVVCFPPESCGADIVYRASDGTVVAVRVITHGRPLGAESFVEALDCVSVQRVTAGMTAGNKTRFAAAIGGPVVVRRYARAVVSLVGFTPQIWQRVADYNSDSRSKIVLEDFDSVKRWLSNRVNFQPGQLTERPEWQTTMTEWSQYSPEGKRELNLSALKAIGVYWAVTTRGRTKADVIRELDAAVVHFRSYVMPVYQRGGL